VVSPPFSYASPAELAAAFERSRAERDALPADELGRITTNVPNAVTTVLGAEHNVSSMRGEIRRRLPEHPLAPIDNLRRYALGLLYVHVMTLPSAEIETRFQAVLVEGGERREHMLGVAEAYARLGLFDAERVAAIRSGAGHADTAHDLVSLAQLFHERREALAGKSPFSPADVERAQALGLELFDLLGRRKLGNDGATLAADVVEAKLRAFRLMERAYDTARWAVAYLRWKEGDAERLAPSLFGGRGRRRPAPGNDAPDVPAEPDGEAGGGDVEVS
ncbi:MAG TPA: hypothetical protein VFS00_26360, partial [Polyangiaceae bacterium]|nr:hypothetical protein [Polyangiaceae bacterium]